MLKEFVIYDTEFTAWPDSLKTNWSAEGQFREIIQIAAVKVQYKNNKAHILETFNELVIPTKNPELSNYIIELTGITQQVLDDMGVDFFSSYKQFLTFCDGNTDACLSWGRDDLILLENCRINQCEGAWQDQHYFDLRSFAKSQNLPGAECTSGAVAQSLGVPLKGKVHNALHDVKSLAYSIEYWLQHGMLNMSQLTLS